MAEETSKEHAQPKISADVAAGAVSAEELSADEDRRILRRIDLCLLPIMGVSYMFQFLDKSALGFTAILGLRDDLRLSSGDFSWASGIYYVGYLAASYPAGVLMVRWRVGKTMAVAAFVWGAMLMAMAATTNAASLLAVRFLLGVAEAPIAPGLTVVVAMWYKRAEQPMRHAAWFLGVTAAGILGGLVAYAIGHIDSIAAWKAVFLIFGAATVAWSAAMAALLPDVPMTAWFLDAEDRAKAVVRVRDNMTGIKSNEFKWRQCCEALADAKTWFLVVLMLCGSVPNGGVHSFGPIIIEGLGFDALPTLLLGSGCYLVQLVLVLGSTAATTRFRNSRTVFMACNFGLAAAGAAVVRQCPPGSRWARYAGYCMIMSLGVSFPLGMSLTSGNFGGFTKVTVNAVCFMAYCVGNMVGPQLFFAREAPSYASGFLGIVVCFGVGLATSIALRLYLVRENRRRDLAGSAWTGDEGGVMVNLMDKTDKELPQFRYVY